MRRLFLATTPFVLSLLANPGWAAPLTNPLTADQVACDELQLERLAQRIVVRQASTPFFHPSLFLWRSDPGGGSYSGLAVTDEIRGRDGTFFRFERQLALDVVTAAVGDSLNPTRGLLPRATLVRRDAASNLVTADDLRVTMALEPVTVDPFQAIIPVVVNNLAPGTPGAAASASGSGLGITGDDLTSSCESLLTPFDQRIFTILARTVRVSQCAFLTGPLPTCNPDGGAFNITLFRGADPQTYRVNVYSYGEGCTDAGSCTVSVDTKVAYEFKLSWDGEGRLTTGTVSVLPACPTPSPLPCINGGGFPLFVLPPLWAGHAHQGSYVIGSAPRVGNDVPFSPLRPSATIDWQALLARSAWN